MSGAPFLFLFAWFAVALAFSTAVRESGNALIFTLVIFFVISLLLPVSGRRLEGPPPQHPGTSAIEVLPIRNISNATGSYVIPGVDLGQQASVQQGAPGDRQEDLVYLRPV